MKVITPKWPTKAGFAAWLKARGKKTAGICGEPNHCALAEYCRALNPEVQVVAVNESVISMRFQSSIHQRGFSNWQCRFIDRFDFQVDGIGAAREGAMSGNDALECLR